MFNIRLKYDTSISSVCSYQPKNIEYDYSLQLPSVPNRKDYIKLQAGEFYVEDILFVENEDYILLTGAFRKNYK